MLLDILAWSLALASASVIGAGVLVVFGAHRLRPGDRAVLAAWIGVIVLAVGLLAVSLVGPLSPGVGLSTTALLTAAGVWVARRDRHSESRHHLTADVPLPPWARVVGLASIAVGAAALASDPVTLYDSLVYHVGIIRWLSDHGTVPGVALIHNRLGHVSAWFTLGAPFDAGLLRDRAANVPLGLALVLVAAQASLGVARLAARRGTGADAFLALSSIALLVAAVRYNTATPSPDMVTNALIVVVAWSLLVVPHVTPTSSSRPWNRWLTPRLLPFVLGVGASTMKLFAVPAAVAAAMFYSFAVTDDRGAGLAARRVAVCAIVALVLMLPFLAANVAASGCPLYPSPIACLPTTWSVGGDAAAAYAEYVRDVARWDIRRTVSESTALSWVGRWVAMHPVLFVPIVLSPLLGAILLLGPRRGGMRSALLVAILGLGFTAWQAPAPRFLHAFGIIAPVLAVSFPFASALQRRGAHPVTLRAEAERYRTAAAFVLTAIVTSAAFAVASQKVNVVSAVVGESPLIVVSRDILVFPAAPAPPSRLYRWRVNDVEVFTPVPRPIADTLSYASTIDGNVGFEKCSTAPLPCTPYLPARTVALRVPTRGISSGFAQRPLSNGLAARERRCLGELVAPFSHRATATPVHPPTIPEGRTRCGSDGER